MFDAFSLPQVCNLLNMSPDRTGLLSLLEPAHCESSVVPLQAQPVQRGLDFGGFSAIIYADYGDVLVNFERKLAVRLVESSNVCRFFGIALPGEGPTEFET